MPADSFFALAHTQVRACMLERTWRRVKCNGPSGPTRASPAPLESAEKWPGQRLDRDRVLYEASRLFVELTAALGNPRRRGLILIAFENGADSFAAGHHIQIKGQQSARGRANIAHRTVAAGVHLVGTSHVRGRAEGAIDIGVIVKADMAGAVEGERREDRGWAGAALSRGQRKRLPNAGTLQQRIGRVGGIVAAGASATGQKQYRHDREQQPRW